MIQIVIFWVITVGALGWAARRFYYIYRKIRLGRPEYLTDQPLKRWKNMFLVAFGQQKMFKRPLSALFHLFIYAAFLLTQIELVEIISDGFTGKHRLFARPMGSFYTFLISFIEILSLLALVSTIVFLWRRNIKKVKRFHQPEMMNWPFKDGNYILLGEIILIAGIFLMNGADQVLQRIDAAHYPSTGRLVLSGFLADHLFMGWPDGLLKIIERIGWWLHYLTILAFINYLAFSKHLHILLAFPNTWFIRLNSRGEMENIPAITQEIKSMLGLAQDTQANPAEIPVFGAKDVRDLSWKNLLDAYTCTECGRCTSVCPANLTGKKLSPRKIMMDVRDRLEEINLNNKQEHDTGSLLDRIAETEIWACTTCNACVEECPVQINPLDIIIQLRRHLILNESKGPAEWLPMFNSLENGGAVWQVNEDRDAWMQT